MARKRSGTAPKRVSGPSGLGRPMDEEETFSFLLGVWIATPSSNVAEARYLADEERLEVGFDGGNKGGVIAYYGYPGVTTAEAQSFATSGSKGVWVDLNLKKTGRPFYFIGKGR